ncbi:MAG: hypothetical protein JXQ69_08885 [Paludibacteraceae bacterium]|nr:hypothetical protein [Paludibacteraceae bacterium]
MSDYLSILTAIIPTSLFVFLLIINTILGKEQKNKEKLFDEIDKKFKAGLIKSKEDLLIIINSFSRQYNNVYSLGPILEDYITYRLNEKNDVETPVKYDLLKTIINQENKEKPYENIPDEERRLFLAINDNIKYKDFDVIKFNLHELSMLISTRHKSFKKIARANKWSIPIAIISLIITVFFGIIQIFPNAENKKLQESNRALIEKINYNDSIQNIRNLDKENKLLNKTK